MLLAVGFITIALAAPNAVQLFKYFKPKNARERERIKKSLTRLEKQGLIKQRGAMDGYFVLTAEGKAKAMRYKIEETKIQKQKRWDRKWRLVMFDVPEEKESATSDKFRTQKNRLCTLSKIRIYHSVSV